MENFATGTNAIPKKSRYYYHHLKFFINEMWIFQDVPTDGLGIRNEPEDFVNLASVISTDR